MYRLEWLLYREFYHTFNFVVGSHLSLSDLFYTYVQDDIYPCFRLTNATHQIGCSGDYVILLYNMQ